MEQKQNLQRNLKSRHVEMIALGCAIGTGLFYGASSTIQLAGPAVSLAYAIGGIFIYFVIRALGEMSVYRPVSGSFPDYAQLYWSPIAGFIAGWNYWFLHVAVSMAELSVIGLYVHHWFPDIPSWISTLTMFLIVNIINLLSVKIFGELEFWGSFIKVSALALMIIFGLFMIVTGIGTESSTPIGLHNLWQHGGFFATGWKGLIQSLVVVTFSFGGTELIGVAAGEAQNPEKTIPKSVNMTLGRILIFYIGAVFVLVTLYPWNEVGVNGSPFVEIFSKLGISIASDLLNIVVIIAALSAYNSCLFANARLLHSMALHGNAPKFLAATSKHGVPWKGVFFSSFFVSLVVFLCYILPHEVFTYIMSIVTVAVITSWILIILTHFKFRKFLGAEGVKNLSYKTIFYPYANILTLGYFALVIFVMISIPEFRIAVYLAPIWLAIIYIGYRFTIKNKLNK